VESVEHLEASVSQSLRQTVSGYADSCPGLNAAPGIGARINLECWVDSTSTPYGKIYAWKYGETTPARHQLMLDDTEEGEYIFPIDETGGENGRLSYCRRSFDLACAIDYIDENGEMSLQFDHLQHAPYGVCNECTFDSYYDLIQVVKIGDPSITECPESDPGPGEGRPSMSSSESPPAGISVNPIGVGADINRDGVVDEADATFCATLWTAASLLADMNNDKVIDSTDASLFAAAYGS